MHIYLNNHLHEKVRWDLQKNKDQGQLFAI